jgi:8-oxo-dGTP pyrophosphatase MutT (NUDIX family)
MVFDYPSDSYRVTIKAVILVDNHLLLVREDTGLWDLPGGGIEHGEGETEALQRELKEEIGIELKQVDTDLVYAWPTYDPVYKKPTMVLVCSNVLELDINDALLLAHGAKLYSEQQFSSVFLQKHMEKYRTHIAAIAYKQKS